MHPYLAHLIQTDEIQPVLVTKDITADDGSVLIPAQSRLGAGLDANVLNTLSEQESVETLGESIALENEFDATLIYEVLTEYIASDPTFEALCAQRGINENLIASVEAFAEYPILRQRLNVLAIQLPEVFDQALFCGWVMVAILAEDCQPQSYINAAFIAALSHDLGLLDISPDLIFKTQAFSADEWLCMQQHPIYSAAILKRTPGIDTECRRAVLEHHETIDGTGYPQGKFERHLSDLGQALHLLDSVNAIYRKHFKIRQRSLGDMVPIIQMSTLSHAGRYGAVLVAILNQASTTDHCAMGEPLIPAAIDLIKNNANEISSFIQITNDFSQEVGTKHKDIDLLTLQNMPRVIRSTMNSCGIINEAYMRWLDQVGEEKLDFAYRELEDVLLMTQEIKFHVQRYHRQIAQYLRQEHDAELMAKVEALRAQLSDIPQSTAQEDALQAYLSGIQGT